MLIKPPIKKADEMLIVFNDTQLKHQCDEEALGAALSFVEKYAPQITHFVFNGDISDYEQQTHYAQYPDSYARAKEEIEATRWLIETITNMLPRADKVFVDGNHEDRWSNMIKDQTMGLEEWIKTPDEMFKFKELGWEHIGYGRGKYYRWHDRIFWHGARAGAKSNIPKQELDDAGVSVTTAHINRNMFHEYMDAFGNYKTAYTHGGFSKDNLAFMKKAATGWTQGFGVYFWNEDMGEHIVPIHMRHKHPYFLYNGEKFDGTGFKIP